MTDALAVNLDAPCWIWQGARSGNGYGHLKRKRSRSNIPAHRYMWEVMRGPIPNGLVVDHLCRVPLCVNPQHMELVTNRENILRGNSPAAKQARQTQCKRGHLFDDANTRITPTGARRCRACDRQDHRTPQTKRRVFP
jgi:hypothetical protein